ncbi:hypothetical protein Q3G72_023882 [Acer saccharum]|nr:hypothetical protein Q3G72_017340 [Acer saccharum]KAK1548460.1 hypothetical protein Q3G72_023882 [Acer saccharum]
MAPSTRTSPSHSTLCRAALCWKHRTLRRFWCAALGTWRWCPDGRLRRGSVRLQSPGGAVGGTDAGTRGAIPAAGVLPRRRARGHGRDRLRGGRLRRHRLGPTDEHVPVTELPGR